MPPSLPRLGLGTWQNDEPDQCAESVRAALELGYRHVDTAQAYGNEEAVGRGIRESSVDRDEIFLATKVSTQDLAYEDVLSSTADSLSRLDVELVDLLYVHWPLRTYDPGTTLEAFNELHDEGLIRNVGVSNFEAQQLATARKHLDVPLLANQVEMHPLCQQDELLSVAREHDHWLVAYSPLARGEVFGYPVIRDIAGEMDASPAQVCLAWLLSKENVAAVPKATGEAHIQDNIGALDLELEPSHIERIDGIDERKRMVNPASAPWNQPAA